jgi:hypothetical protein
MSDSSRSHVAAAFRRLTRLTLAAALSIAGMFGVTTTAHADTPPPTTLPAGRFCSFDVVRTILTDNRREITNPSGDHLNGHFVAEFANPANGKAITFNVSGATQTSQSGNILTVTYTGPSFLGLGPGGRANTGAPAISYLRGRTVLTVDLSTGTVQTLSTTAPITDICKLLA